MDKVFGPITLEINVIEINRFICTKKVNKIELGIILWYNNI